MASLKKLRDGLDDFNSQVAAIDGAGMRPNHLATSPNKAHMCRMNQKIKFLIVPAVMFLCAAPAIAEDVAPLTTMDDWAWILPEHAPHTPPTLGSCIAAAAIAERHDNEWQEPAFTPDECAVVSGQAIDAGYVLMNPDSSKKEISRALRVLSGEPAKAHTYRLGD